MTAPRVCLDCGEHPPLHRVGCLVVLATRRTHRALFVGVAERAGHLQRVTTFNRLIWRHE